MKLPVISALLLFTLSLSACSFDRGSAEDPRYTDEIDLRMDAIGSYSMSITTNGLEVQKYFDQGLQLMYAFGRNYASRSFREGWKRDSTCAMCHWGEAWALGPNINSGMRSMHNERAYEAIQKSLTLAGEGHATVKEMALIEAMAHRYPAPGSSLNRREADKAYALAMENVHNQFPDSPDVSTIYAEALFILEPRHTAKNLDDPGMIPIYELLENVNSYMMHPGACHLYIHAIESTSEPERGLECASYLATAMPGASHINHMPSHIWNQVGMWNESVRTSINAWHADLKAEAGLGFSIYSHHNLHMLMFAASYDGQGAIAIQAGKDFAKTNGNEVYKALALVRFGRFNEILNLRNRPSSEGFAALWDFAQGYAALRTDDLRKAERTLSNIQSTADNSSSRISKHSTEEILNVVTGILEGEILRTKGDLEGAREAFEKSIQWYDALEYNEPEILPFSPRHWLGNLLLEMKFYQEAEQVYLEELEQHPNNGWSLFGLKKALREQNKPYESVMEQWKEAWARSDTWIVSSRF